MRAVSQALRRRPARDVSDLPARLEALQFVVTEAPDQLDRRTAAAAERLLQRAGQRLRLSADHTVVALAGGTGSGKSSLFNALTGLDISQVGLRRPTTSAAYACVWGEDDATQLLDWLQVPPERRLGRESVLDAGAEAELHGLVLLDLPDHDSVEVEHRLEVDRLVDLVDILVWVLDPQKYADTAIHEHYLRPLRTYADVMLVVLNQADRLDPGQAQSCLEDLRRMLTDDGLGGVRTMLTSATSRVGVADLRAVLTGAVTSRESSARRIAADLDALGDRLTRSAQPEADLARLEALAESTSDTLSELAGVSRVASAAEYDYRAAGRRRTAWPPLARRHRRDQAVPPLAVLRADLDQAARSLAGGAATGLPQPWRARLERVAAAAAPGLADGLDEAVHAATQTPVRPPAWWRFGWIIQWLLLLVTLAGVGWAVGMVTTATRHWPLAAAAVAGLVVAGAGILLGLSCAVVFDRAVTVRGEQLRQDVEHRLRAEVDTLTETSLLVPLRAELDTYDAVQRTLAGFSRATKTA